MVGRPSRRVGSGREALTKGQEDFPHGREWSGGLPGEPGVVGRPFQRAGRVGRPLRRVGKPSRRAVSGQEALPEG